MLCSWPSGRSSLGLYNIQYVLSAAYSIMRHLITVFSKCHIAAGRPIKAAANAAGQPLSTVLHRGKISIICQ